MATVTAISTKGGGGGKASLEYICRDDKTENKKYVTALNCSLPTAYQEFKNTREMYGKTSGIKYYHFVQSHPSGYDIAPELAHKIAVEFAERAFKGHECVVAKKVRAGIRQKHKTGMPVNLPMGYYKDKNTGKVLVDETAAAIVREIFEKFFEGYGLSTIAKDFNRRGIKSPEYFSHRKLGAQRTKICKKYLWVQTTVKRIIQNEAYTGTLVNHKTVTSKIYKTKNAVPIEEQYRHENYMPAIIDRETFDQAQILLESRQSTQVRAKFGSVIHRYCGMIKCAECGASLIAKKRTVAGHSWVEYTCNSNHRYGNEYCTPHTIREEQLDEIIHTELVMLRQEILDSSQKYDEIVREWNKKKPKYDKMIKDHTEKIVALKTQIEELIMERINDREHATVYNSMIEKREAEIQELTQKIEDCKKFDELSKKRRDELMSTAELLDEVLLEPYISDTNIRLLVRRINVHENEDGTLDVTLEFNGDFDDSSTLCREFDF